MDGGVYCFNHRREGVSIISPSPRTYTVTEGPDGALSNAQSLSGGQLGYARYIISVVYDLDYCVATACWEQETDVEGDCVFNSNW